MNLNEIAYCEIFPGIGIARLGSSANEWFLAPEIPGVAPKPEMNQFKDHCGLLKRQGARFRVYGFNAAGEILGEINADMAHIEWRVHLANIKAAWYRFENAMDLDPKFSQSAIRRNLNIQGDERSNLVINPGIRIIAGKKTFGPAFKFDNGQFFDKKVYLGELQTDELGRLIVLGGHGVSFSHTGNKPTTFANNEGWCDDTSDGPVRASITIDGKTFEAKPAWVVVTPPNFAPDTWGVVTMYDALLPIFQKHFNYAIESKVEFWQHIYPIFKRLAELSGLNFGAFMLFGPGSPFDLYNDEFIKKLSDISQANKGFRERILKLFRDPDRDPNDIDKEFDKLPPLYGDVFGTEEGKNDTNVQLSLTSIQYGYLKQWVEGNIIVQENPTSGWDRLESAPLEEQPKLLNRAHLESVLGGPFHPGIELTWTLRIPLMWASPFRLNILNEGQMPQFNYGETLTPEVALSPKGPFSNSGPGMLTAFLGVPWQTDQASCDAGYQTGVFLPLPSYWAPRSPNQVLSEASYHALKDQTLSKLQRMKHLSHRSQWYRLLKPNNLARILDMVTYWDRLGVIIYRNSPSDRSEFGLPPRLLVETELTNANDSPANMQVDETWQVLHNIETLDKPVRALVEGEITWQPTKSKLNRILSRDEK